MKFILSRAVHFYGSPYTGYHIQPTVHNTHKPNTSLSPMQTNLAVFKILQLLNIIISQLITPNPTRAQQQLRWAIVATTDMGLKEGGAGSVPLSRSAGKPSGLCRGLLPYQLASSSIQPFGHNSVGCQSTRRNISTNYYLVVEMHTVTVRSDDARYLLN